MGSKKKKIADYYLVIAIVIIVILVLYVISFGKISTNNIGVPKEYKDSKEEAKRKHKRIKGLLEKQIAHKNKLEKIAKRVFLGVRIGLVLLWIAIMSGFWYFNFITDLEDFLNYSEAGILLLVTINFLTFGTITDLKEYIDLLKTKTYNWVFGKYINIGEKIETNKNNLVKLDDKIKET